MFIRKVRESVQCKEYEIQNDYAEQNDNKKKNESVAMLMTLVELAAG